MFSTKPAKSHPNPDARIADAARALQTRDVPPGLREKAIADFAARTSPRPGSRVPRRIAIGTVVAAAIGVAALLSGPRVTAPVSASEVVSAIQKTNTWHLSGWRLQKGKKVRWEVWGRRYPFFYREQIGNEIVSDDGKMRVHVLPPQRMHPRGLLLIMPTRPLHTTQNGEQKRTGTYDTAAFLAGTSGDYAGEYTLQLSSDGSLRLNGPTVSSGYTDEQVQLTADPKTRLPLRYELIRRKYKDVEHSPGDGSLMKSWVKAALRAEYNVPMPLEILQGTPSLAASAPDYQRLDLTASPELPTGPQYGITRQGGITVACETLDRDAEGNLRLKYQIWLGDVKTGLEESHLYPSVMLRCRPYAQSWESEYPTDDAGKAYLNLNPPDADTGGRSQDYELRYLTVSEPYLGNATRTPTLLTVPVRVQILVIEEDMDDDENHSTRRSIAEELLTLRVPLPAEVSSLNYDRPRPQIEGLTWEADRKQMSLRLITAWQRGVYWSERGEGHDTMPPGPRNRAYLLRAKREYAIAIAEAERAQDPRMIKDMRLNRKFVEDLLSGKR